MSLQMSLTVADAAGTGLMLPVSGARVTGLAINGEVVEGTDHGSRGWRKILAECGHRRVTITIEGLYLKSAGEARLRALALTGDVATCALRVSDEQSLSGAFAVARLAYSGKQGEAALYEAVLESASPVTIG